MKKFVIAFITAITLSLFSSALAYGGTVRVGLEKSFKNVSAINVSDTSMRIVVNGNTYRMSGTYTIKPVGNSYYATGRYFDTYDEANSSLVEFTGSSCIVALTDNGWTIYIRTDGKKYDYNIIHTSDYCVGFAVEGMYKFIVDSKTPVQVGGGDDTIDVGTSTYRGLIEIYRTQNTLTAINVIDEDKYLCGVINSEMPSSWSIEAQKAQAVAARTYTRRSKGKHGIYDVCDGVHCQDYNGTLKETANGISAVNATSNVCVYYNDSLIEAVYYSSDGGATVDGADAWGSETPYLKGKTDPYEKECLEWTREFTYRELTDMCNAKGYNLGNIIKVEAKEENGIVTALTFSGSKASKTVTLEEVRTAFSASAEGSLKSRKFTLSSGGQSTVESVPIYAINSNGNVTEIKSNSYVEDSVGNVNSLGKSFVTVSNTGTSTVNMEKTVTTGTSGKVTIVGRGYGHGVGMSQYGAKAMAEQGFSYKDILQFYYTDVEVK